MDDKDKEINVLRQSLLCYSLNIKSLKNSLRHFLESDLKRTLEKAKHANSKDNRRMVDYQCEIGLEDIENMIIKLNEIKI
tara:strand:- start:2888 stop:3127 length:240 start_codon:yes stop_codon:yes gene_type:complete